jgi:DNA-directed RNA polymerase specialized sigma24 family protein
VTVIDWAHVAEIADKTARSIASAWSVVEKDDVKQAILLHAYERRTLIEKHYDDAFLWTFCKKAGNQYASKERDARDVEDGNYYYTPDEAKLSLATFIYSDEELGQMLGKEDDLLSCRITDNLVSARLDASQALNRLSKSQRAVLMRRYVFGIPPKDDTERKASNRGLDALARQMNRDLRKVTA